MPRPEPGHRRIKARVGGCGERLSELPCRAGEVAVDEGREASEQPSGQRVTGRPTHLSGGRLPRGGHERRQIGWTAGGHGGVQSVEPRAADCLWIRIGQRLRRLDQQHAPFLKAPKREHGLAPGREGPGLQIRATALGKRVQLRQRELRFARRQGSFDTRQGPAGRAVWFDREPGRAGEEHRLGGVATAGSCDERYPLQLVGDTFVPAGGGPREVPGAAVTILLRGQGVGERRMRFPPSCG